MRLSSTPDATENTKENAEKRPSTVNRDPSYPDRARIDSDVRAFLRPASSPWIVFDRDSRIDGDFAKAALRIGAVFASSPSLLPETTTQSSAEVVTSAPPAHEPLVGAVLSSGISSSHPATGMFPETPHVTTDNAEPSNMVVASDLAPEEEVATPNPSWSSLEVPGLKPNRRRIVIGGSVASAVLVAAALVLSIGGRHETKSAKVTEPAPQKTEELRAPAAAPTEGEHFEIPAPTPVEEPKVVVAEEPKTAESKADEGASSKDPKKRFGRLVIKDAAKGKMVWFDGKRMLGNGQRSFLVFCGMHTVAVADKSDMRDVEIPCNGEYVVSK